MSTGTIDRLLTSRMVCERLTPEHAADECRLLLDPRVGATLWGRPTPPTEAEIFDFANQVVRTQVATIAGASMRHCAAEALEASTISVVTRRFGISI